MVCGRCGMDDRILLADPILEAPTEGLATRRGAVRAAGRARGVELVGLARAGSLRRCTLPITALRVTPSPSWPAIWLALNPSIQGFFKVATRSSVQPAGRAPEPLLHAESFIVAPNNQCNHQPLRG